MPHAWELSWRGGPPWAAGHISLPVNAGQRSPAPLVAAPLAAPCVAAWLTQAWPLHRSFLCGRLAAEPYPLPTAPRTASPAHACPSSAIRALARPSVREPGDGAGARRPGMALALGRNAILWLHPGQPKKIVLIAQLIHGRPKTIRDRLHYYNILLFHSQMAAYHVVGVSRAVGHHLPARAVVVVVVDLGAAAWAQRGCRSGGGRPWGRQRVDTGSM
jgi:hypothetical protein